MFFYRILPLLLVLLIGPHINASIPVAELNANDQQIISSYKKMYSEGNNCIAYDPYEKLNRKIYYFNSLLDYFILRPIALTYYKTTNDYIKARVGSFVDNVSTPLTTVNYGLQLNLDNSIKSLWRFIINTTFGVAGLFDVASKMGLEASPQTFGSTLAHYGVGPGPYIVIPFLGGTFMRDVTDPIITNNYLNPVNYAFHRDARLIFTGGKLVHERAIILPFTDHIMNNSLDPYIAIRSSIYQNRESNVQYPVGFVCPH